MHMLRADAGALVTALFDPDPAAAARIGAGLASAGFVVERRADPDEFVNAVRAGDFRTIVVVGDLADGGCLRFAERIRRAASHSWLLVANRAVDGEARRIARRHGVDVLLPAPLDVAELARRLEALQAHSRPTF